MEDQVTNIAEILKDRPKGTRLYSTELGILRLIDLEEWRYTKMWLSVHSLQRIQRR